MKFGTDIENLYGQVTVSTSQVHIQNTQQVFPISLKWLQSSNSQLPKIQTMVSLIKLPRIYSTHHVLLSILLSLQPVRKVWRVSPQIQRGFILLTALFMSPLPLLLFPSHFFISTINSLLLPKLFSFLNSHRQLLVFVKTY